VSALSNRAPVPTPSTRINRLDLQLSILFEFKLNLCLRRSDADVLLSALARQERILDKVELSRLLPKASITI
jgi:hypothetical protein